MMENTQEQIKEENPVEENVLVDIDDGDQKNIDTKPVVEKEEERTNVRTEQSDDELDEYSENVQKRINQLTAKRKQALEEADAAFKYAEEQKKKNETNIINDSAKVLVFDFGTKLNIFNSLYGHKIEVETVSGHSTFDEIIASKPHGILLSNGPGDPAATNRFTNKVLKKLVRDTSIPIFGICLGHQLLGLALGAKTEKMNHGHHGANHPVLDLRTGKVEITSMNHGFAINTESLPQNIFESHVSLFDGSNCGIEHKDKDIFSVQYHPEASPGPHDSLYLFSKFVKMVLKYKNNE